ncbi:MAG: hypothetical protein M3O90_00135, partial [Actinomycetota bacterium]|nr:hypothetical protein [Actinomycetota bacterium]
MLERGGNLAVQVFGGRLDGGGFPAIEAAFDALIAEHARPSWFFGNVYDPARGQPPSASRLRGEESSVRILGAASRVARRPL